MLELIRNAVETVAKANATNSTDLWLYKETFNGLLTESTTIQMGDEGCIVIQCENHRIEVKFDSKLLLAKSQKDEVKFVYAKLTKFDEIYTEPKCRVKNCIAI